MNSDSYRKVIYEPKQEDGYSHVAYMIYYQDICCPITEHHFYTKNLNELAMIFKGQFMGQNNNSAFQRVKRVKNNYIDEAIFDHNGAFIKSNAPLLQLVTRRSISELSSPDQARRYLSSLTLPTDDSQLMVKYRREISYTNINKKDYKKMLEEGELSFYYPVITYEEIQHILDTLPKVEIDFTCVGLGSAGTGILDQVARSTWMKKYMLIDMDIVEEKNLRNQWYQRNNRNYSKTTSSKNRIQNIYTTETAPEVIEYGRKFQEVPLNSYISKYVVSGFDSIECRLELLDKIMNKEFVAKYLIDVRYDDLTASVFFIDVDDEKQVAYYKAGLEEDLEAFKVKEEVVKNKLKVDTFEKFIEYCKQTRVFECNCGHMKRTLGEDNSCAINTATHSCGGDLCLEYWSKVWDEKKDEILAKNYYLTPPAEESSCVKQNFIDIYKFSSSFVFAAIREIEDGNAKPFTHIDTSTEMIPKSIIIRR